MIDYQNELNEEQHAVVKNGDGPCLVLAGAGSGKTRTITYRVAYLLEHNVQPNEILLVTFTNKAAREMTHRIQSILGKDARLPWAGTFHHIAFRILRKWAPLLGYQNNFTILDTEDSRDVFKLCLKQEGIDRKARRFPSAKAIQSIISYARNAELSIEQVLEQKYPKWIDIEETISRISSEYAKRKKQANAMDFDDLLVNLAVLLTKSEKVRQQYSEQFKYVLVDEYQDTNKIQATIIRLFSIHHKNLLVVGDDAQSIYSFRAADIQNILDFEQQFPNANVFRLETNYRSTPEILDVANQVIAQNNNQYQKELRSVAENFAKPEVHPFTDMSEEARHIADRILELRDEGIALQGMAVLFRAAFHSQALEVELVKRDIPYEYRGGVRFFERAHIKDVLAYLRIFNNHTDTIAWSRVLNMQTGIGPATVQKILTVIARSPDEVRGDVAIPPEADSDTRLPHSLQELAMTASLSTRAKIGWNNFLQIYQRLLDAKSNQPSVLIRAILDSKYEDHLLAEYDDAKERVQDIEQLSLYAEGHTDLTKFLGEVSLQEGFSAAQAQKTSYDDDEKMVLSTVHQAKGLEWDAVFIINLANGQFPNERAAQEPKGIEEERRLFYVALTRARKHLSLSYSLMSGFGSTLSGPSLFLDEIDQDLLDHHNFANVMGTSVFTDPSDDIDDVTYVAEEDSWSDWGQKTTSFLKSIDEL